MFDFLFLLLFSHEKLYGFVLLLLSSVDVVSFCARQPSKLYYYKKKFFSFRFCACTVFVGAVDDCEPRILHYRATLVRFDFFLLLCICINIKLYVNAIENNEIYVVQQQQWKIYVELRQYSTIEIHTAHTHIKQSIEICKRDKDMRCIRFTGRRIYNEQLSTDLVSVLFSISFAHCRNDSYRFDNVHIAKNAFAYWSDFM